MSLAMFRDTPTQALRKIEAELRAQRADLDFRRYYAMTPRQIEEKIERMRSKNFELTETMANRTWLLDPNYMYRKLFIEGLEIVRDLREEQEEQEQLQPGMMYYAEAMQFGPLLKGKRCFFVEGRQPCWISFSEKTAVQKALEVLRFGSDDDFRKIYVEQADGRPDALLNVDIRHIRESSPAALAQIEAYCDSRWDGPWPWEKRTSLKLQSQIEESEMDRKQHITEMHTQMERAIRSLYEEALDKYEVVMAITEIIDQVDKMIQSLGKLSSSSIEATASARALVGDQVGQQIEGAVAPVLTQAAQSLSGLKAELEHAKSQVEQSTGAEGGMGGGTDMMGTPGGAMGQQPGAQMGGAPGAGGEMDPMDGDVSDNMADVDLGGSSEERDMKGM
jgi:hypothetical protein